MLLTEIAWNTKKGINKNSKCAKKLIFSKNHLKMFSVFGLILILMSVEVNFNAKLCYVIS